MAYRAWCASRCEASFWRGEAHQGHLYVTCYTEGFSHFVTSMTAPVASGWSVRRAGLAPTGKRRLLAAHAKCGRCREGVQEPTVTTLRATALNCLLFAENGDSEHAIVLFEPGAQ